MQEMQSLSAGQAGISRSVFPGEDGFINTYTQRLYQGLMGKETLCFQEPAPLIRSHFNQR